MHLTTSIKRAMVIAGDKVATIDGNRIRTWAECGERVRRLAGALSGELALAEGARAAILALNSDRYFEFSHAVPWAGGVFVPINTRLAAPEIEYWLGDSGAELLFVDDNFAAVAASLRDRLPELRDGLDRRGPAGSPRQAVDLDRAALSAAPSLCR